VPKVRGSCRKERRGRRCEDFLAVSSFSSVRAALAAPYAMRYTYTCFKPVHPAQNRFAYCEVREETNKMQQLDVYYQYFLNMFPASLCPSSGEQYACYCTWCAALVLLDVVGSCCWALRCRMRTVTFTVLTPYNAAPNNRYQPHPAEPAQHTTCSNTRLVLLKMGIMMAETC